MDIIVRLKQIIHLSRDKKMKEKETKILLLYFCVILMAEESEFSGERTITDLWQK
jgi:hypothetical protein